MSQFQHTGDLYRSHILPFSVVTGDEVAVQSPQDALRVSYDGHMRSGESRIFAVIPVADLGLIGRNVDLPQPPGIGLPGSDVFFMKTPDGVSLYIDTDRQEDLFIEILDTAHDMGYTVAERGLGYFHQDGTGHVSTPKSAAFDANNFENVPIEAGYKCIEKAIEASLGMTAPFQRKSSRNDPGHPSF